MCIVELLCASVDDPIGLSEDPEDFIFPAGLGYVTLRAESIAVAGLGPFG